MIKLPWLWLNEAAVLVSERLGSVSPQNCSDAAHRLDYAREELLGWARRGALEVQGRRWELPGYGEEDAFPESGPWVEIDASLWNLESITETTESPISTPLLNPSDCENREVVSIDEICLARSESNSGFVLPDMFTVVYWDTNSVKIDGAMVAMPYGYRNLRVRRPEIDQIIPSGTGTDKKKEVADNNLANSYPKNLGGAPRKFRDDLLMEIIRIADLDGLPDNKADLMQRLREYNDPSWKGDPPSESTIYTIVKDVYMRRRS